MTTHLPHPPFTFTVERFEPGELRALAYRGNEVIAEHVVRTPGRPARIEVVVDDAGAAFHAGGDLVFLYARIVDEAARSSRPRRCR